jgi:hypothetical protein
MAPAARTPPRPRSSSGGIGARLTAKVGPLPVWLWATILLGVIYLYERHAAASSSSSSSGSTDTTDTTGTPANDQTGGGGATGTPDDSLLSQLSGFQSSIDALTAAVQSSQAFPYGSDTSGDQTTAPPSPTTTPQPAVTPPHVAPGSAAPPVAASHPAAKPVAVTKAKPVVKKPAAKPISGYAQASKANLH